MATEVYTTEEVTLQNGKTVTVRPLSIATLRKFNRKFDELGQVDKKLKEGLPEGEELDPRDVEDASIDVLVDLAAICLKGKGVDELLDDREALEEALDTPTIYKLIEVCAGIKLNDPELAAAAMQAMQAAEQSGQI